MKTCGTTVPLLCLKPLLHLVWQYTGFDYVEDVFYSRKNFKRPDLQMNPHKCFEHEVAMLEAVFSDRGGSAYCFGALNKSCWYLYTLNPLEVPSPNWKTEPDQTLEILMTNLDPDVSR
jgi:S-adenosylmethionine decarboxylase